MRWPWVSRFAFDVVKEECERLAAQNVELTDALTRIKRWDAGMSEKVRPPEKPKDEAPAELWELVRGFESDAMRQAVIDDAMRARRRGTPWNHVIDALEASLADDDYDDMEPADAEIEPTTT